jgi:hypothetical protein
MTNGSKLCRTELYLWVYNSVCEKNNRPQSKIGKLITDKYDTCIEQTENPEAIESQIRQRMQSEALQKVKEAFLKAVKPLIPQSETGNLSTVMAMVERSLKSTIDVNTSAEKLKFNQKKSKRSLKNLIMTKTADYAARWLYRLLGHYFS